MCYPRGVFNGYYEMLLDSCDHYIYLSSCRVYDDLEQPIKETSPRLLDSSPDEELKASSDYCIHIRSSRY